MTTSIDVPDYLLRELDGEDPTEEQVHKAIRLYAIMDNPDELLAESALQEAMVR